MHHLLRFTSSVLIAGLGVVVLATALVVQARPGPGPDRLQDQPFAASAADYPNCRFGVGGDVRGFSVAQLNVGWSMEWSAQLNPPRPNGADYFQVVTIRPAMGGYVFTPPTSTLHAILDQNPGATWLVSNEPDSPWQDNLRPETYAAAYHQLYYLIKQRDPSALVAAGNIVQPTPLRMQYLDRVLNSYRQTFKESLPADIWSVHSYILREIDPSDPEAMPNGPYEVWGAYIPPGITATRGMLYSYSQMFDVAIFKQRLIDFRQWMRDRGYGDKPLYITEYGTLFPYPPYATDYYADENGVLMTEARTAAFMTKTFATLQQLTHAQTGYAADANRLVQRWLWYSVSDESFGGLLFDPTTRVRRPLGNVFAAYTHALPPEVDLLAVQLTADPLGAINAAKPQTATLRAQVSNVGNISVTRRFTVEFYAGYPLSGTLIAARSVTIPLAGCGAAVNLSATWPALITGVHPAYVRVVGAPGLSETDLANNVRAAQILVAPPRVYLPLVRRVFP
jgi:hypothetical protein